MLYNNLREKFHGFQISLLRKAYFSFDEENFLDEDALWCFAYLGAFEPKTLLSLIQTLQRIVNLILDLEIGQINIQISPPYHQQNLPVVKNVQIVVIMHR